MVTEANAISTKKKFKGKELEVARKKRNRSGTKEAQADEQLTSNQGYQAYGHVHVL